MSDSNIYKTPAFQHMYMISWLASSSDQQTGEEKNYACLLFSVDL